MKKFINFLIVIIALLSLSACNFTLGGGTSKASITLNEELPTEFVVGTEDIDFTKYFIIKNADGERIVVDATYLDLTDVDFSKTGTFQVTVTYGKITEELTITVVAPSTEPQVSVKANVVTTFNVDTTGVDFTTYFTVLDANGDPVVVTSSMLDLSEVDFSQAGTFKVTLTYENITKSVTITVTIPSAEPNQLAEALAKVDTLEEWNFVVDYAVAYQDSVDGDGSWSSIYEFLGNDFVVDMGDYVDYVYYNPTTDLFSYYAQMDGGEYEVYLEGTTDFDDAYNSYIDYFDLWDVVASDFALVDGYYVPTDATKINTNGKAIFGDYDGDTFTSLKIKVVNGYISEILAASSEVFTGGTCEYQYTLALSDYGQVAITLPDVDEPDPDPEPTGTFTSNFSDSALSVGANEPAWSVVSGAVANNFTSGRGVQFEANSGARTLGTVNPYTVSQVVVTVNTNRDAGWIISVSVGDTVFTCNGATTVTITKTDTPAFSDLADLTFTTPTAVTGTVKVTLSPVEDSANKSLYVNKIAMNGVTAPLEMMEDQVYDGLKQVENSEGDMVDVENYDQLIENVGLDVIGLPSTGDVTALVIPIHISGTTAFSATDLARLNSAFNGTSADTGWQSVSSYYKIASNNLLNLQFDIQDPYTTKYDSNYYNDYNDANYGAIGDWQILIEALQSLENAGFDFSKYDSNNDMVIDGVYLIYSEAVDYVSDDSLYWAYVSWYAVETEEENVTFGGYDAYTYLFAGFDFLDEDAMLSPNYYSYACDEGYGYNISINASTYIHETGHMLGLDDYYDYYADMGCNEGLGGADMMDYTVGEHNAFSKMILGWLTPTIVTTTQTLEIAKTDNNNSSVIMVLLDWNGTYFSEYLLIDLYTPTGLNEMHAGTYPYYLFDNSTGGVRIYHVNSAVKFTDPYDVEATYGGIFQNNNSTTDLPLIKLIEADGETKFASSDGYAMDTDLWQAGTTFSDVYANYTRNDGKLINFDITINSIDLTNESASITITMLEK